MNLIAAINKSIKTRVALIVSLFVLMTAVMVGFFFFIEGNEYIVEKEMDSLEHDLIEESLILSSYIQTPREDVLFLASTPPIQGIIRAKKSRGIDSKDKSSIKQWKQRLEIIFKQMLYAKSRYLQIRFIGKVDAGLEIVRVQRTGDNKVEIVPAQALQKKAHYSYFNETEKLHAKEIYMSDIELNREFNKVVEPYLPVMRISTPVYDDEGEFFGIVIINMDFSHILAEIKDMMHGAAAQKDNKKILYVTSDKGEYLVHPEKEQEFGFEFGHHHLIYEEYPVYNKLFGTENTEQGARARFEVDGVSKVAYFHKSYFDPRLPERFLGMALVVDYDSVVSGSYEIRNRSIFLTLVLVIIAVAVAVYFAGIITRNISRISAAAQAFAKGEIGLGLPVECEDEIGVLARTFKKMINQVKERDDALRENEQRFSGIIELAEEAIISIDDNQVVVLFNRGAEKIFGYEKHEIIGRSLEILLPDSVREHHHLKVKEFSLSRVSSSLVSPRKGLNGRRKNGDEFPIEASISKLMQGGKNIYTAVVRDISVRLYAEEKMKIIQMNLSEAQQISSMGSYVWDVDSGVMEWSDGLFDILQYAPSQDATLKKIADRVHPDDRDEFNRQSGRFVEKVQSADTRFRVVLPDKSIRSFMMSFRSRVSDEGILRKMVGTLQDITNQAREEEEKHKLQKQLQQSQKMEAIGQLTGGIAHDFNNILASILGYASLAEERYAGDNVKLAEYLQEVTSAGERARDLVAQMLAFSRGGSSESRALMVEPLVNEAVKMIKSTIPSSIELRVSSPKELPRIMMDPVQMHQLVMNLCINARDAMSGRGQIEVEMNHVKYENVNTLCNSCKRPLQGDYLELAVKDTGRGIEKEIINRIFDPFFSTKEVGKGTGMGLSMVHGIVHDHGGHIVVDSRRGEGTAFRLLFPVIDRVLDIPEDQHISLMDARNEFTRGHAETKHILIVDDESSVAGFLRELFETRGYKVTVETESEQALALFKSQSQLFDIVITDQTMPKLTGAELAKGLLEIRPELPIILCTGYSEVIDEATAFKVGISSYHSKPIDPVRLCQVVSSLLGGEDDSGHEITATAV